MWGVLPRPGAVLTGFQPLRHNLDDWERMMMKRDYRLTGSTRGQAVRGRGSLTWRVADGEQRDPTAPPEFATNSFWSTERVG